MKIENFEKAVLLNNRLERVKNIIKALESKPIVEPEEPDTLSEIHNVLKVQRPIRIGIKEASADRFDILGHSYNVNLYTSDEPDKDGSEKHPSTDDNFIADAGKKAMLSAARELKALIEAEIREL